MNHAKLTSELRPVYDFIVGGSGPSDSVVGAARGPAFRKLPTYHKQEGDGISTLTDARNPTGDFNFWIGLT